MSRPLWFVAMLRKVFPARFLLAEATKLPLLGRWLGDWLFEGDGMLYLPENRTLRIHEPIPRSEEVVLPSQVVEHFIHQARVHWLMDACICRQANNCQDYPIELGCLFLGSAALGINPKLGRRVSKEQALAHIRRCREAGLIHLIGRNKLDTVWLGVSPERRLLTICNCCPCCCLWRVLPNLAPRLAAGIQRMPGLTVSVNERCLGCGTCTQGVCFVDAIHLQEGRAVIADSCRGCGRCVELCPEGAIEIHFEHQDFTERAIARISPLVDLG